MKGIISFYILFFVSSLLFAQEDLLTTFRAAQVDNGIKLSFTLRAGVQCNDLEIQRSDDDVVFNEIGIIPGICGSISSNESYEFTDTSPLINKDAYYRLNLRTEGFSYSIKTKFINYNEDGLLIYPNPFTEEINFYIKNDRNSEFIIFIYDHTGKLVLQQFTHSQLLLISRAGLSNGSYFYKLVSGEKVKSSGTLVIQ